MSAAEECVDDGDRDLAKTRATLARFIAPIAKPMSPPPPHDLEVERVVLGGIIDKGHERFAIAQSEGLAAYDFFEPFHQSLFAAMIDLHGQGEPFDHVTLNAWIKQRGLFLDEGAKHIAAIGQETPAKSPGQFKAHCEILVRLGARRRGIASLQRAAALGYGDVDHDAWLEVVRTAGAEIGKARVGARSLPTASDAALALLNEGPIERMATGLETFDDILRGGLRFGTVFAIGGAPNTGKTALAVQLGTDAARAGYAVAIHAADVDDREGILIRIGQYHGLTLRDLEAREPGAIRRLAEILSEMPTLIVRDQDEDECALEDTIAELVAHAEGRRAVLVVDSLQTVRTRLGADSKEDGERVKAAIAVIKRATKTHGLLTVATSEVTRGYYRSKKAADNCVGMAAFKHSGDIEYAVATGILLRSVPDEGLLVDVEIAKAKRGNNPRPFRLERSPSRCTFREVPLPEEETASVQRSGPNDEEIRRRILLALAEHTCGSKTELAGKVKGNNGDKHRVLDAMIRDGAIVSVAGRLRSAVPQ